MSKELTPAQIRAVFAKKSTGIRSQGTIPLKSSKTPRLQQNFDIERIKGTDNLIVREKGRSSGVITTQKDLNRVLRHIEEQKRIKRRLESKTEGIEALEQSMFVGERRRQI